MCFYHDDVEWYAAICETADEPADRDSQCYECGDAIPFGAMRRRVYQQEHEECQRCEFEELEPDEEPCEQHDYGETVECDICMPCVKLLAAIEAVEAEEGCPPGTRQPMYGALWEEMTHGNCDAYLARALEMYPELSGTAWSERLEKRIAAYT